MISKQSADQAYLKGQHLYEYTDVTDNTIYAHAVCVGAVISGIAYSRTL